MTAIPDPTRDARTLDFVFGDDDPGASALERARRSRTLFVRDLHRVGFMKEGAKGYALTAHELASTFGLGVVLSLGEHGTARFAREGTDVRALLRGRAESFGLSTSVLAAETRVEEPEVGAALFGSKRLPLQVASRLAAALCMDVWNLGVLPNDEYLDGCVVPAYMGHRAASAEWVGLARARLRAWGEAGRSPARTDVGSVDLADVDSRRRPLVGATMEAFSANLISTDTAGLLLGVDASRFEALAPRHRPENVRPTLVVSDPPTTRR